MKKYGMAYRSIKYWQDQAKMVIHYNGGSHRYLNALAKELCILGPCSSARAIGRAAIQAAATNTPDLVKITMQDPVTVANWKR